MSNLQYKGTMRRPKRPNPVSLTARQVAHSYGAPIDIATGKGYTGGLVELVNPDGPPGGGYDPNDLAAYFNSVDLPLPSIIDVPVLGAVNAPDYDPNGSDGEIQSDLIVAGSIAPAANWRCYFAPNSIEGFYAALLQATLECDGVSVSYGSAENTWPADAAAAFEKVMLAARRAGKPVFTACGDQGSDDGTGTRVVDFPSSAPSAIPCGGTRLELNPDGTRLSEVVWDDNPSTSATGGGVSKLFPGRRVPDLAGDADPDTGYEVSVDGESTVIGGTSLVAPLMLGCHALLHELTHGVKYDLVSILATGFGVCFDVTIGNNGYYRAGPGRDDDTGFGVPYWPAILLHLNKSSMIGLTGPAAI